MDLIPTPSQTVGPFFSVCLTAGGRCTPVIAGPNVEGERFRLSIEICDGDNLPVPDAMIELWQADARGRYYHPDDYWPEDYRRRESDPAFLGFGRLGTDENGQCEFHTIKPGRVGGQAPHIAAAIFARGLLKQLYTRIYFDDDAEANAEDPILKLVPQERRSTLMAIAGGDSVWRFQIHLQGERETVFFDI